MSAPPAAAELFSLEGRTAVVTGASAGLGARFAAVLAQAGATVFAAARRIDRLKELADAGARIHPVACDVSLAADRTRLIETARTATGRVDILVNNAATSGETRAEDESPDAFADVLGTNLTAPSTWHASWRRHPPGTTRHLGASSTSPPSSAWSPPPPWAARATRRPRPGCSG
nr:SDR family NAD(P)-dependent oxidoreductase [Streptomyces antimycoticus]